jgi:hypothetical protein
VAARGPLLCRELESRTAGLSGGAALAYVLHWLCHPPKPCTDNNMRNSDRFTTFSSFSPYHMFGIPPQLETSQARKLSQFTVESRHAPKFAVSQSNNMSDLTYFNLAELETMRFCNT